MKYVYTIACITSIFHQEGIMDDRVIEASLTRGLCELGYPALSKWNHVQLFDDVRYYALRIHLRQRLWRLFNGGLPEGVIVGDNLWISYSNETLIVGIE